MVFINYSVFQKKINYDMIIQFVSKENFWYLVVLASDDLSYCFYIKIEAERKIAKKIVSGKWTPIVYMDDFVTGWKVVKNWPSWTFDADAWKKIVIGIQDTAAGSRGLFSTGENVCDDISSSDCIDMDEESIEDNDEKKY